MSGCRITNSFKRGIFPRTDGLRISELGSSWYWAKHHLNQTLLSYPVSFELLLGVATEVSWGLFTSLKCLIIYLFSQLVLTAVTCTVLPTQLSSGSSATVWFGCRIVPAVLTYSSDKLGEGLYQDCLMVRTRPTFNILLLKSYIVSWSLSSESSKAQNS